MAFIVVLFLIGITFILLFGKKSPGKRNSFFGELIFLARKAREPHMELTQEILLNDQKNSEGTGSIVLRENNRIGQGSERVGDDAAEKPRCVLDRNRVSSYEHSVFFSEIAWMGGEKPTHEWVELHNTSRSRVSLVLWQMQNAAGDIVITFPQEKSIKASAFFLLERIEEAVPSVTADLIYRGALRNKDEALFLFDAECKLVDTVAATPLWPAGSSRERKTMERASDYSWYTSSVKYGTPRKENSSREHLDEAEPLFLPPLIVSPPSASPKIDTFSLESAEEARSAETVAVAALVAASSSDVASPSENPKNSESQHSIAPPPLPLVPGGGLDANNLVPYAETASTLPILISEVQITAGSGKASNDFVKLYNPHEVAVNVSGWKLRKRTQSGSESSIRVFPDGSEAPPRGIFTWANSEDGFAEKVNAQTSSTQTLTASSSIALFDKEGSQIDALAWGTGHSNPFGEGAPYPESPGASQILHRKTTSGGLQDTNANAADFEL